MIMNATASYAHVWTALGWAVVHFWWQGTVIWLAAAAIRQRLGRRSPGVHYAIACTAMGAYLIVFVASFLMFLGGETASSGPAVAWLQGYMSTGASSLPPSLSSDPDIAGIAAYCWVVGLSWMLLRYTYQWIQAQGLRHRSVSEPDAYWQDAFESLKSKLGVQQPVRLLRSGMAKTAMLVGCFRPVVLIPICAFTKLTPDQLRAVIAHELAHIRRFDHWINIGQSIVEIVLFFHPAVWWLSRQVRIEREYCCDDLSIRASESPRTLAEGLASLESLRMMTPSATALFANGGTLLDRISRIIGGGSSRTIQKGGYMMNRAIAVIAAATLMIGCSYLAQTQERPDEGPKVEAKGITVEGYQAAEKEIRKLVEEGGVSPEDAEIRLVEMRRAIADNDSGDGRQEDLEGRTEGAGSMSVEEYRAAEKEIRKLVEEGRVPAEAAETRLIEMRRVIRQ